jgi:hypothetical protein
MPGTKTRALTLSSLELSGTSGQNSIRKNQLAWVGLVVVQTNEMVREICLEIKINRGKSVRIDVAKSSRSLRGSHGKFLNRILCELSGARPESLNAQRLLNGLA